jgi:hypothetical protein
VALPTESLLFPLSLIEKLEQNTEIHNCNSCRKLSLHVECCGNSVFFMKKCSEQRH